MCVCLLIRDRPIIENKLVAVSVISTCGLTLFHQPRAVSAVASVDVEGVSGYRMNECRRTRHSLAFNRLLHRLDLTVHI